MRQIMQLRDSRQADIAGHPFFDWLRDDGVALDDRLTIAPAGALFIMQFADMNKWVLRFPETRDEYQWVINLGTQEDEKHSRLFLEDWRKLGLDARLGWRTSDVLWWLFLSPDQEPFRRVGIEFMRLAVDDGDNALIRFGHSEIGEAAGHVMLDNTAKVAAALSARTGLDYRYFGPYHLDLESGHVGNTEGIFETVVLDETTRAAVADASERMFRLFYDGIFTGFHDYAKTYIGTGTGTVPSRPEPVSAGEDWTAPPLDIRARDAGDQQLVDHLDMRTERLREHPFFGWISASGDLSAADRLRRFIPMWTMDILGYRDLTKYALAYPDPTTDAERAVDEWARRLSAHSGLFLSDWDALDLDEVLGHTASTALEWLFLDRDLDLHRQNMMEFGKIAMRHTDPALRWWMIVALESTGEQFFRHTRPLALEVEAATGRRLDYLAGRHDPARNDDGGSALVPPAPLTDEQIPLAREIVDHIFDSMERQLWLSLAVARGGKYATG